MMLSPSIQDENFNNGNAVTPNVIYQSSSSNRQDRYVSPYATTLLEEFTFPESPELRAFALEKSYVPSVPKPDVIKRSCSK
jgi:hypothetical protein